jgi:hypothetical protein
MRPTEIQLKRPEDRTPGPKYNFNVTNAGKSLEYAKKGKDRKTFSTEKRFKSYEDLRKRTGDSVGPGSYIKDHNSMLKNSLSRSTIRYLPTLQKYDFTKNNFYMVGNLLVSEPNEYLGEKKKRQKLRRSASKTLRKSPLLL